MYNITELIKNHLFVVVYYKVKNKLSYTDFTYQLHLKHVKEHSWQSLYWEATVRKRQWGSCEGGAEPKYGAVFFNEQVLPNC